MIPRYTRPRIGKIWTEENRYSTWLDVEIAACEAQNELGVTPDDALKDIKEKADFDVERIEEIEAEVHHDVIAFLTSVSEYVGPSSKYVHYGMTSSDVVDTALSVQMKQAIEIVIEEAKRLTDLLLQKAKKYKETFMVGRTHGVHAEPTTFGLKILLWHFEMKRNIERLERARDIISVGKISGAVGNYANIDPLVEEKVCAKLGLKRAEVSTQILQRDRHAEYLNAIAITGASLEKFSIEIRSLQRTDVMEAREPFSKKQKGSSAMPHKRNPIITERITGLARLLRTNALAAMENIALWHERDISHSSVERVIVPDSTILLDYMLAKFYAVLKDLVVYPENMLENLNISGGLVFSQQVLLALVQKGLSREDAYTLVQVNAMRAWNEKGDFNKNLHGDEEVAKYLNSDEIDACFDLNYYLKGIEEIFKRP